jgi:hypothetical protein
MISARMRPGTGAVASAASREMMARFSDLSTATVAAFQNPALGPGYMNARHFRQAQLPALNGHGTARGLVKLFDQLPLLLPSHLLAEAVRTQVSGLDEVLRSHTSFGLGLMVYHPETPIGTGHGCYGHAGAGGRLNR